ncbi:MAG: 2'-deoxycytidine 5'-triphosphate deaminase [Candidatus Pacearchaeota archaeon]|jgi:dCTP deaminase
MKDTLGYCLVSQQIRERVLEGNLVLDGSSLSIGHDGFFEDKSLESRIQPSSFEPSIGDECFVLDSEKQTVFGPEHHQTVYRTLLGLPRRQRQRIDLSEGFEFKTGFTYVVPLRESVVIHPGERIKASPKSSIGRLFPIVRTIADYNPGFDELHHQEGVDGPIKMWLLVQPTAFNMVLYPGLSLNQLRFFNDSNVSLSQQEITEEFRRNPLLCLREGDHEIPVNPVITDDGLQINLDLSGEYTGGIVALRARRNPTPIDLSKTKFYGGEEFFEPVEIKGGEIRFYGGERYLIASKGVLHVPDHLSAELRRHYGAGMRGTWDEAGFVDNGFIGDLVFEVGLSETGGITLSSKDERKVSALEFFRTNKRPDKVYGKSETGSHYQGQLGPRISKHFLDFDFDMAARNYKKLHRDILVHDARVLRGFRKTEQGFEVIDPEMAERFRREVETNGFFHSRYDCEGDEEVLQVIPYVLVFDTRKVFAYVRATDIEVYGDRRLFGKHSIGLGGHVNRGDGPNYLRSCLERQVMKEEVAIDGTFSTPKFVGTIVASDTPVDKVHFGAVYKTHIAGTIRANEKSITSFGMRSFEELSREPGLYETWSKILIPELPRIYDM